MSKEPVTHKSLDELEACLARTQDFPPTCVPAFAGLLAHYGRRLDYPTDRTKLRSAVIKFLDKHNPVSDFDDVVDCATLLLNRIESERGGIWPIRSASKAAPIAGAKADAGPRRRSATTIQVERGLGSVAERGITDENMLHLLAVCIVRTETPSEAAAIAIVLKAMDDLGFDTCTENAMAVAVNRTWKSIDSLPDLRDSADDEPPAKAHAFTPADILTAYADLAATLAADTRVALPGAPETGS